MIARILDITTDQYHRDEIEPGLPPTLSSSIAKLLCDRTPAHAKAAHPRLSKVSRKEDTASMTVGTLLHRLVLNAGAELVPIDAEDYRTKAAQARRDEVLSLGGIPVIARKLVEARETAIRIVENLAELGSYLDGKSEVVVAWEETASDGSAVHCRAMMDHVTVSDRRVTYVDLKTCENASPGACERAVAEYSYEIQAAAYESALSKLYPGKEIDIRFAFAEVDSPNVVNLTRLDGQNADLGRRRWAYAVDKWHKCLTSGKWSARYPFDRTSLVAKAWKLGEWELVSE